MPSFGPLDRLGYTRARANPTDDRSVELGVIPRGGKKEKARALRQIEEAFDDLVALVEHLTILDMAAALEKLFNARISTAVGEARKTLRERHRRSTLAAREKLVRETEDFQGLNNIETLLSTDLSGEMQELFKKVRENRNRFVHGTDIRNPPTILEGEAQTALNEVIALLQAV